MLRSEDFAGYQFALDELANESDNVNDAVRANGFYRLNVAAKERWIAFVRDNQATPWCEQVLTRAVIERLK